MSKPLPTLLSSLDNSIIALCQNNNLVRLEQNPDVTDNNLVYLHCLENKLNERYLVCAKYLANSIWVKPICDTHFCFYTSKLILISKNMGNLEMVENSLSSLITPELDPLHLQTQLIEVNEKLEQATKSFNEAQNQINLLNSSTKMGFKILKNGLLASEQVLKKLNNRG